MSFIIYSLIIIHQVYSGQILPTQKDATILNTKIMEVPDLLVLTHKYQTIMQFNDRKNIVSIKIHHADSHHQTLCYSLNKEIYFDDYQNRRQYILPNKFTNLTSNPDPKFYASPYINDPAYFLSNPILANMVQLTQGLAMVTTDHQLFIYSINQSYYSQTGFRAQKQFVFNYTHLRTNSIEAFIPQLVYEPITYNIYIIYPDQIITANLKNQQSITFRNLTIKFDTNFLGNIKISQQYLFIPAGIQGLYIYKVLSDGNLQFTHQIDANLLYDRNFPIFIVDCAIGGIRANKLYVLDRQRGVTQFFMSSNKQLTKNNQLNLISCYGGNILKEFDDQYIMILVERGPNSFLYEVGIHNNDWFHLRTHELYGHYQDFDITKEFVMLRGVDSHKILYYTIWQGFMSEDNFFFEDDWTKEIKKRKEEESIIIPSLQKMFFYSENYGVGDPATWHFNQTHSFILGLTKHDLIELPWIEEPASVECYNSYIGNQGKKFKYEIEFNSTFCFEKGELLARDMNNSIIPQLVLCNFRKQFQIEFFGGVTYNQIEKIEIILGLFLLSCTIIVALVLLYRKYKGSKKQIEQEIVGLKDRGYDVKEK